MFPQDKLKRRFRFRFTVSKPIPTIEKKFKKLKEIKSKTKRLTLSNVNQVNKESNYEIGRWKIDEHQRFVQAIIKYGNDWKKVQKCVRTRSSTQARSHAQKFFIKIKKSKLLSFNLDLSKSSIKMFHDFIAGRSSEEYEKILKDLYDVHLVRKGSENGKRRNSQTKSLINSDSTEQDVIGISSDVNILCDDRKCSDDSSDDELQERGRKKSSINSYEGFFNFDLNLLDESYDKKELCDKEGGNAERINDKEYANTFNLAFCNECDYSHKFTRSRKTSLEDDFLFNSMKS